MPRLTATYRLQLHRQFGFRQAGGIASYLRALGVSHAYTSPILAATPGSTHGYDVVDPAIVNPELGGDEGRRTFAAELREHDLGYVLDIVPNHMGIGRGNRYWEDVLAKGRGSPFAHWFDVDWMAGSGESPGRIILPVLGEDLDRVLARGELSLVREEGSIRLKYFDRSFPLSAESIGRLPESGWERWGRDPETLTSLRQLIERQHYRLVFWRRATDQLNYRRFFDVTDLAALRMENDDVFDAVHARVLEWVADGSVTGLRIDHVDGLRDPLEYLTRLRRRVEAAVTAAGRPRSAQDVFPIVVEKILSRGESLRGEWPVQGTTGYEFLADLEAIFVHPEGFAEIRSAYLKFGRVPANQRGFGAVAHDGKLKILGGALRPDIRRLARLLLPLARRRFPERRVTPGILSRTLERLVAYLPVYRTYVDGRPGPAHPDDRCVISRASARAAEDGSIDSELLAFISCTLSKDGWPDRRRLEFVLRLQQTSGAATAKGVEDTALYQYVPLVSLNEVGGDPARPLTEAVEQLHRSNAERASHWPNGLTCINTHDTKRSADVRARLAVLSEIAPEWLAAVRRWRHMNRALTSRAGRRTVPDPNTEYLLYQTLVGIWPAGSDAPIPAETLEKIRARTEAYMVKAVREAKQRSTWTDKDRQFEDGLKSFITGMLDPARSQTFVTDLTKLVRRVARPGFWNSLSRVLIHLSSPGIPDVYQGDDLWHFALVDPDNRRPVDYQRRAQALAAMPVGVLAEPALTRMLESPEDGCLKLYLTTRLLHQRRLHPDLFVDGTYEPVTATGSGARHVISFARRGPAGVAVAVAARFPLTLARDGSPPVGKLWRETRLLTPPAARWRCALGGHAIEQKGDGLALSEVLERLPVALLFPE